MGGLFVGLVVAIFAGALGANARYDVAASRYGTGIAEELMAEARADGHLAVDPDGNVRQINTIQVRGGADSSSRRIIWEASLDTFRQRPVLGYGAGTDATAIAGQFTGQTAGYRGLSSHDTVLRMGVEGGVVLLATFGAVVVMGLILAFGAITGRVAGDDPTVALASIQIAVVPALVFETLFFGGLTSPSLLWTLALGALAVSVASVGAKSWRSTSDASDPQSVPMTTSS
jgi:O-antigen ligase